MTEKIQEQILISLEYLESKKRVLEIYPDAYLTDFQNGQPKLFALMQGNPPRMISASSTMNGAWNNAWKRIQKTMLEKFEAV